MPVQAEPPFTFSGISGILLFFRCDSLPQAVLHALPLATKGLDALPVVVTSPLPSSKERPQRFVDSTLWKHLLLSLPNSPPPGLQHLLG